MLYFKDITIPDYLKLFYQQTNGLLIESEYFCDEFDSPSHFRVNALEHLSFTTKKLNQLPDKRFLRIAEDEDFTIYLMDMENLDPNGNPLILLNTPANNFCIPLTNSFDFLLESACLGLLSVIHTYVEREGIKIPQIPSKMLKKRERILSCIKDLFQVAKREYALLNIWHIPPSAQNILQASTIKWFKGMKELLTIFK